MPHAAVSANQRNTAKRLRQRMTRAETLLWRYLKAGHLDGVSFRRQTPMGRYIVDFVCHGARVVVEIDGASHDFATQSRYDAQRDAWLASRGYLVMRFRDEEVLRNLEGVWLSIGEKVHSRLSGSPPSLPSPARGEGTR